ncbi:hypothetical protein BOTBODRAFT_37048 [Botryobasidium botryosum FD-172 SS1]|uniref:Uncharacterized protein n=1 Tax=Botryobasidium botryosum (strain FD-172 SS1) TaxID=930990 RepID=A0A067M438_BOTB1|nr:hypothetical protein BOTBODRAFT_37048 [Botryobasidium botryosum FD-172 SS1]
MSQLESLSLDWSECDLIRDFDINDYTALLSSATNLSNLCLRNDFCLASTVDPLLSTLIATPSTHLCPRLAKMEFTIDQGLSPSTMALLLEVVGSRRRAGGRRLRLRKVKLDFIVDRESVKKLRSLGIDVETYWWHMDPPILFSAFTPSQPFNRV